MNEEKPRQDEEDEAMEVTNGSTAGDGLAGMRTVRARDLIGGDKILRIEHEGQIYTLRITRNDRLILTK